MSVKFWTDEPEDNRSIEEIVKSYQEEERYVTRENARIGMKVRISNKHIKSDLGTTIATDHQIGLIGVIARTVHPSGVHPEYIEVRWPISGQYSVWWHNLNLQPFLLAIVEE